MRAHPSGGSRTRSRALRARRGQQLAAALSRSPSSRRALPTRASCSWATWATSSSVVSPAGRAERAQARPKGRRVLRLLRRARHGRATGSERPPRRSGSSCGRPGGVPRPRERRAPRRGSAVGTGRDRPHAGWDFTLSAPKSVSLAWALADEPLRAALAEAHRGRSRQPSRSSRRRWPGTARVRGRDGTLMRARHRLLCPPRLARARSAAPHAWDRLQSRRRKATGDGPRSTPA